MSKLLKFAIAIIFSVLIFVSMYFGAYLPLRKSQLYIKAISELQAGKIKSLQDFDTAFGLVLNFYSPVGQDEIVSNYFSILANVTSQQTNKEIIEVLIKQAEVLMAPILKKGRGFNYSQNLYNFAMFYKIAGQKLNSDVYLQKSIDLFQEGLKYSPGRLIFKEKIVE